MKNVLKVFAVVAVIAVMSSSVIAGDKEKKKERKGKGKGRQAGAAILKKLEAAGLSEEQKKQIKEIVAANAEKMAAISKKLGDARKTIAENRKKAVADGKKGKELREAISAGLTEEQKEALAEIRKSGLALRDEIAKVLTDEQKQKAGFGKRSAPKKKKKADKDS